MICNSHFDEASKFDDAMPADWNFAPGWKPPVGSNSTAYLLSDTSGGDGAGIKVIQGDDPILLDSEVLVPVETGKAYRLTMRYRLDAIGEDPRGRINMETSYLDADGHPIYYAACSHNERISCSTDADCGDGNRCSESAVAKETVASPFDPSVTGSWSQAERTLTLAPYTSASTNAPVQPRFAKIRLFANAFFRGEASIREVSMTPVLDSQLGVLPQGAIAYDLAPLVCVGGDGDGDSCQEDSDCGEGTCGAASSGFQVLPKSGTNTGGACEISASRGETDSGTYPTQLLGRNVTRPTIECQLDGASDYVVSLYMGGYWRNDPRSEIHGVTVNDATTMDLDESQVCSEAGALNGTPCQTHGECGTGVCRPRDIYNDLYFERVTASLVDPAMVDGQGYAIYDEYIWPRRYRRHDLPVKSLGDGRLNIAVSSGSVGALVITPGTPETADLTALDDYENAMRNEFVSRWANFVDPEDVGLPVVQGQYQPGSADYDRGFVLFQRHWMDFVEFSSRPEDADVIHDPSGFTLAFQATPGEYEPRTFSLWPLRPLNDVTLEVSDLRSASGDSLIPASNVSTSFVQSRPQRLNPPTAFSYLSGFLPDWEQRDLHTDLTQRAWLNVHVPEGTPAATYSGTVTLTAANAEPIQFAVAVDVLPFELVRPERTNMMHLGPGNGIIMPVDRDLHRRAASQHLKSLGFRSEIGIWWPSLFRNGSKLFTRDENGIVEINWDARVMAGTADEQVAEMRASNDHTRVWIDSNSILRLGLLEAFGAPGSTGWTVADTEAWLRAIEKRFGPSGHGFEEILIHVTAEENHYEETGGGFGDSWYAWLDFLAHVANERGPKNWPHVRTVHTFNTHEGQERALAEANVDVPALGMFHGVHSNPEDQIFDANAAEKPFLLYGLRGRLVPGFYLWKAGASGTYHEWYTRFDGVINDDWDNIVGYANDGSSVELLNEGPGWANAHFSADGKMVGSWMTEELREGVDDDAYMTTLEHWISATASDLRPGVVSARSDALDALQTIREGIDLNAVVHNETNPEAPLEPTHFGRGGLNLVRTIEGGPPGFDALRQVAIDAIRELVTATNGSTNSTSWTSTQSDSDAHLRSNDNLGSNPQPYGDAAGDGMPTNDSEEIQDEEASDVQDPAPTYPVASGDGSPASDPGENEDNDVPLLLPEPGSTPTILAALLSLAAISRAHRARSSRP